MLPLAVNLFSTNEFNFPTIVVGSLAETVAAELELSLLEDEELLDCAFGADNSLLVEVDEELLLEDEELLDCAFGAG